jgi:hypothetical protein
MRQVLDFMYNSTGLYPRKTILYFIRMTLISTRLTGDIYICNFWRNSFLFWQSVKSDALLVRKEFFSCNFRQGLSFLFSVALEAQRIAYSSSACTFGTYRRHKLSCDFSTATARMNYYCHGICTIRYTDDNNINNNYKMNVAFCHIGKRARY